MERVKAGPTAETKRRWCSERFGETAVQRVERQAISDAIDDRKTGRPPRYQRGDTVAEVAYHEAYAYVRLKEER